MRMTAMAIALGVLLARGGLAMAHDGRGGEDHGRHDENHGHEGFASGPKRCAAAKRALAGVKFLGLAKCDAGATAKGTAVDPECVAAVQERFGREWAQVEARGGCVTTGDETTIEDKVDSANGALVDALDAGPPASRCSAGKFKDAGKKAACELFCAANAALHGRDVDPRCDTFCAFKFAVGFKVDEFRHDCHTRHDADQIESAIDAFVDDVIAELPFSGTTTTTVPSTTSTTVSTTSTTSTTAVTTTTSTTAPTTTSTAPTTSTTMVPTTTTTTSSSTTTTTLGSPSAAFLDDPLGG